MANPALYVAQLHHVMPNADPNNGYIDLIFQSKVVRDQAQFDSLVLGEFSRLPDMLNTLGLTVRLSDALGRYEFQYIGMNVSVLDRRPDYSSGRFGAVIPPEELWQGENLPKLTFDRHHGICGQYAYDPRAIGLIVSGMHEYKIERLKKPLVSMVREFLLKS